MKQPSFLKSYLFLVDYKYPHVILISCTHQDPLPQLQRQNKKDDWTKRKK